MPALPEKGQARHNIDGDRTAEAADTQAYCLGGTLTGFALPHHRAYGSVHGGSAD
jgi:hypothetical protein